MQATSYRYQQADRLSGSWGSARAVCLALIAGFFLMALLGETVGGEMEWIKLSPDKRGFELAESKRSFRPWGFNYDRDAAGRLIEDYWSEEWETIESDFREMQKLGANSVRVHLQFARFMHSPTKPNQDSLRQLSRLLKLAEELNLYLNLTGLGCYHKHDVPDWYIELSEQDRWQAQAQFWEAVAKVCADSPAVFCYNLMNEPVVAGGDTPRDDWLGPGFGDKHYVQFITLDRAGRNRPDIARQWIAQLTQAIRKHDQQHLITVGLVPWSLDRPGLTSGFVPEAVAPDLDFIAVHLYPEQGKVAEAIETLQAFAQPGKPVVIEELFPLKCDAKELAEFIERSQPHAVGWYGFYWGESEAELRSSGNLAGILMLAWLEVFQNKTSLIRQD